MDSRVEVVSKELIQPSRPTPLGFKHLKPSFLDQISPPGYIPLVFYYRNQAGTSRTFDPKEITQHLKESLSKCLTKYYPLAGKLNPDLSVDCNDSGALFLEAKVHAPFIQALRNAPLPKINQLLPFHPFEVDDKKVFGIYPRNEMLLAVQVNWFECGSFAIGSCLLHALGDVVCAVTFMNAWASVSRGEFSSPLVPEPCFELGRRQFPPLGPSFFPGSSPSDSDSDPSPPVAKVKNVSLRLLFTKETIAELRKQATTPLPGSLLVKDPTRVELVTAFIWKHFIKLARAKKEPAKTMFLSRHAVNVRTRLRALNADDREYAFGNFTVVEANSYMSSLDEREKTYQDLVFLTSNGLRKVNEDYLIKNIQNDPLGHLQSLNVSEMEEIKQYPGKVVINDSFNTCWNRFPMYEVDFGWGNPVLVTPAGTPAGAAIVVVMPTKCGTGVEAWVGFQEGDLPLLDSELLSLATTRMVPAANIRSLL